MSDTNRYGGPAREPITITQQDFDEILSELNPINRLWAKVESHFYGERAGMLDRPDVKEERQRRG